MQYAHTIYTNITIPTHITIYTNTGGGTALSVSKLRPNVPIIAACYDLATARWLAMAWGVYPVVISKPTGN